MCAAGRVDIKLNTIVPSAEDSIPQGKTPPTQIHYII